jgi:serine/arginine repetitive matrix protein 2
MEEDDSFLDGVIDFGDGKQYTITPTALSTAAAAANTTTSNKAVDEHARITVAGSTEPAPRGKEKERDEFDRSWPKSTQAAHTLGQRDLPPHTAVGAGASTSAGANTGVGAGAGAGAPPGRALFNERSNRMEPVSSNVNVNVVPPNRWKVQGDQPSLPIFTKRGINGDHGPGPSPGPSHTTAGGPQSELRDRGRPPHMPPPGSQQPVQKEESRPDRSPSAKPAPPARLNREPSIQTRTRDSVSPVDMRGRDAPPHAFSNVTPAQRRVSYTMPPPPVPSRPGPASQQSFSGHARRLSTSSRTSVTESVGTSHGGPPPTSPSLSKARDAIPPATSPTPAPGPTVAPAPVLVEPAPLPADALSLDEATKVTMQSAAERAKQRRQQEEEDRLKAIERAKQKAAELERRMVEAAKASEPPAVPAPMPVPVPASASIAVPTPTTKPLVGVTVSDHYFSLFYLAHVIYRMMMLYLSSRMPRRSLNLHLHLLGSIRLQHPLHQI